MENSPGKTGGTAVVPVPQKETQEQKVRLQIVLLFYDHTDSEWGKTLEDGFVCIQKSKQLRKVPFEIEGIESSNNEIIEKELLPIKEIIEIPKGKKSSEITKLQQNILDLVNREKCSNSNKIILDILCPTDNKTIGQKDIYLTFLFDKSFAKQLSRYIDVKKSTISLLYPLEDKPNDSNNTSKDEDKSPKDENKPTKLDVKIAALMSHYVYFYLDWLEYVHVHVHGVSRYLNNQKNEDEKEQEKEIIKEFDFFNERGMFLFIGFKKGIFAIGGKEKVKYRVINRLREIAKVVSYSGGENTEIRKQFEEFIDIRRNIVNKAQSKVIQKLKEFPQKVKEKFHKSTPKSTNEWKDEGICERIKEYLDSELNKEYKIEEAIIPKVVKDSAKIAFLPFTVIVEICGIRDRIVSKSIYDEYKKSTNEKIDKIYDGLKKSLEETHPLGAILDDNKDFVKKFIYVSLINIEGLIYEKKYDNKTAMNQFIRIMDEIIASYIYMRILLDCKKNGRPVGFYDLYDKFGYWDYLKDQDLKEEAKHWYVSHPYIIYKNDYAKLEKKAKDNSVSIDAQKPYKKILWVLPRKTDEIFIAIDEKLLKNCDAKMSENQNAHEKLSETNNHIETVEKRWLVYNTVLTHGMDQLSGYGGLLFTKVDENGKAKKFAYCTKGTDVNSLNDWLFVDVLQGVTGFSLQHLHNVKNAITINKKVEEYDKKTPLFYCGHSLGGGLASACAIASKGRHAITFNAAGLNFLGVLATRTIGGFNYGLDVTNKVHPIRIDGEAIDALMVFSFIVLAHLNERAYGNAELILKLKGRGLGSFIWLANLDEMGAKHGINNFLYKPLMDALDIVDKKTIKYPVEDVNLKNTSIASLGSDQFDMVDKTDGRVFISGNYVLKFKNSNNEPVVYKSILKCSYEDVMKLFSEVHIKKLHPSMKESAKKYLKKMYGFECPD